jgi:hypothetical protein
VALEVVAYEVLRLRSTPAQSAGATNTVTVTAPDIVPAGYKWVIEQCSVSCALPNVGAVTGVTFALYDRDPSTYPEPVNSTIAGQFDTDSSSTILIDAGDLLYLQWTFVPQTAICKARIQYKKVVVTDVARPWGT